MSRRRRLRRNEEIAARSRPHGQISKLVSVVFEQCIAGSLTFPGKGEGFGIDSEQIDVFIKTVKAKIHIARDKGQIDTATFDTYHKAINKLKGKGKQPSHINPTQAEELLKMLNATLVTWELKRRAERRVKPLAVCEQEAAALSHKLNVLVWDLGIVPRETPAIGVGSFEKRLDAVEIEPKAEAPAVDEDDDEMSSVDLPSEDDEDGGVAVGNQA